MISWRPRDIGRLIILLLAGFSILWYVSLPSGAFYGDDANLVWNAENGYYAGSFPLSLVQVFVGKYRPVFSGLFSILLPIFGHDHHAYELVNDVVLTMCAVIVFVVCRMLSANLVVATVCALLSVMSRFVYFAQSQVWGLMEALATLFLLLLIRAAVLYARAPSSRRGGDMLVWFTLIVFTHERFLLLAPALIVLFVVRSKQWQLPAWVLVVVCVNFAIKTLVFHTPFLEGQNQVLGFAPVQYIQQSVQVVLSLFGVSVLGAYWTGLTFADAPLGMKVSGIVFGVIALFGAVHALFRHRLDLWRRRDELLVVVIAALCILGTAVLLPRLEARFVYAPYVCLLLGLAAAFGRYGLPAREGTALALGLLVFGTALDEPYRFYKRYGYVAYYASIAADAKALLIDRADPNMRHAVVVSNDGTLANFALNPVFLYLYAPAPNFSLSFVDAPPASIAPERWPTDTRYFAVMHEDLIDVTGDVFAHAVLGSASATHAVGPFVCRYGAGVPPHAATPAQLPGEYDTIPGILLTPGAVCTSQPIQVRSGDAFAFVSAMVPWRTPTSTALLNVKVVSAGVTDAVLSELPVPPGEGVRWIPGVVSLSRYAGRTVELQFTNEVAIGDYFRSTIEIGEPKIGSAR
jgi:hypothetical protein